MERNKEITFETAMFGSLACAYSEGLFKTFTIQTQGREFSCDLNIFDNFVNDENYDLVLRFLEGMPVMYKKARAEINANYQTNELMKFFIQFHLEELDKEYLLPYFEAKSMAEITPERFIEKLEMRTISIAPTKDGSCDCTLDFSIDPELSDELLVFRFDKNFEIYDISHES